MADHSRDDTSAAAQLPDSTHVGAAHLQVTGLDRSLTYYTSVLGLESRAEAKGVAALTASGDSRPLLHLEERSGARPVPRAGRLGLYHFAILLPDRSHLGRFVRHLAQTGVRFSAADHLVSEAIYLWDPDGLGIEVYADRPRDTWKTLGDELVLTTDPLDLHALARAAGEEPWRGMPAGTTMGHMHLSVDDLDVARTFYSGALGFHPRVWSYPGALFLAAGGYHHHLGLNTWSAGAPVAGPEEARLVEWQLRLPSRDDLNRVAGRIESGGYRVTANGADRIALDPWGTRLRLIVDADAQGSRHGL